MTTRRTTKRFAKPSPLRRRHEIDLPAWVETIEETDDCLFLILREVFLMQAHAKKIGAWNARDLLPAFRSVDKSLKHIEQGYSPYAIKPQRFRVEALACIRRMQEGLAELYFRGEQK